MTNSNNEIVLITKDGIRHDGRKKADLREIKFEVGVLHRADGSAMITWGRNKILVAVYGPRELHPKHLAMPDKARIRCEYRMATFSVPERKSPAPRRREKEISKILGEALEPAIFDYLYPRSVIDVFVQVLQADGGTRCAGITAAALALADAGIPMRDLVVGCAAGNLHDQIVIDLDDVEDKDGHGDMPIAILPNLNQIVLLQSDGVFTPKQYKEALQMCIKACNEIYKMQREALTTKYARISEEVALEEEPDESKTVTEKAPSVSTKESIKEKAKEDSSLIKEVTKLVKETKKEEKPAEETKPKQVSKKKSEKKKTSKQKKN